MTPAQVYARIYQNYKSVKSNDYKIFNDFKYYLILTEYEINVK